MLDIFPLRETFTAQQIMLCFNGLFTAGLIDELGIALRKHMESIPESPSSVSDVFSVYIEMTQNIRHYTLATPLQEAHGISTIVVSRQDDDRYVVCAGNVVRKADGATLAARIDALAPLDKPALKALFKTQLRQPRESLQGNGAGLGLIDMARKASQPLSYALRPLDDEHDFFSLSVVL